MMSNVDDELILAKARKIYLSELNIHIEKFKSLISEKQIQDVIVRDEVLIKLHTIKGGAGFFNFYSIHETVSSLELLLKSSKKQIKLLEIKEFEKGVKKLEQIVKRISNQTS
jgi:chemotaxis protein histidine kinase CheA